MPKKLLLADDSLTIHRVVELTFADEDFEVISVANGTLAIEKIDAIMPDVVIADVNMPESDGYEVCAYIKNNPKYAVIPVILLKGTFEPFSQERADEVRADGIIQKPFQSQTLIDKVNSILGIVGGAPGGPSMTPSTPVGEVSTIRQPKMGEPVPLAPAGQPSPVPVPAIPVSEQIEEAPITFPDPATHMGISVQPGDSIPVPGGIPTPVQGTPAPQPDMIIPQEEQIASPSAPQFPGAPAAADEVTTQKQPSAKEPVIDDTPFGKLPMDAGRTPRDELAQDASEAGKQLQDAFSPPVQPATPPVPSADPEAIPQHAINIPAAPEMAGQVDPQLLDFSDALGDVSMAINQLAIPKLKQEDGMPGILTSPEDIVTSPATPEPIQLQEPIIESADGMNDSVFSISDSTPDIPSMLPTIIESSQPAPIEPPMSSPAEPSVPQVQQADIPDAMAPDLAPPAIIPKVISPPSSQVEPVKTFDTVDDALAERIAEKVLKKITTDVLKEVAWEIIPEVVAEAIKKKNGT